MTHRRFGSLISSVACAAVLAAAAPAAAQAPAVKIPPLAPDVAIRPYFLFSAQRFTASQTFETIFGSAVQPFWGGGAQVTFSNGLFFDVAFSYFSGTGERGFADGDEAFPLGIPLKASITPLEFTGGYRFGADFSNRVTPYIGGGYGTYGYKESSDFDEPGEDASLRGSGFLVVGGAEIRIHKWASVSADVQYSHVGGVLGDGGISKQLGEDDLGGVAARFRIIIGR